MESEKSGALWPAEAFESAGQSAPDRVRVYLNYVF